jgi:hypothetical protein
MPRYVILEHDHPTLHWDLMLENGSVLSTWRLTQHPRAGEECHAQSSHDHRPLYLDYEGPISGGRGRVSRWDGGEFHAREWHERRIVLCLQGERLRGELILRRSAGEEWKVTFDPSPV